MLVVPKPQAHRGGVALLARQPLGLLELSRSQGTEAQSLSAQLMGLQVPLQVTVHYSVPGADPTLLFQESQHAEALQDHPGLLLMPTHPRRRGRGLSPCGWQEAFLEQWVGTFLVGMPSTACGP